MATRVASLRAVHAPFRAGQRRLAEGLLNLVKGKVNTPSAEADGFTEPLEVGFFRLKPTQAPPLKRAQAEGFGGLVGPSSPSTRNSASSSCCWFSMYCAITSSVTFPLLQQK